MYFDFDNEEYFDECIERKKYFKYQDCDINYIQVYEIEELYIE